MAPEADNIGTGVRTIANGERYEGDFRDGKFNGPGVLTAANGEAL